MLLKKDCSINDLFVGIKCSITQLEAEQSTNIDNK